MLTENLVFIDLETTGTNATRDRIIEVGLCEVAGGELVEQWSSLVNPGRPISPFIQNYTGICDAMVKQAPRFCDLAEDLRDRLQGKLLVAHNARFDHGFLKNEFRRLGLNFAPRLLCTLKLSGKLYPGHRRHGLDALIERHGLNCQARHRALDDARLLWDFVQVIHREHAPEAIEVAVAQILKQPSLPAHLSAEQLQGLPQRCGVYRFFGENDTPLYVGKSVNLRSRVLSHFSGDHRSHKDLRLSRQIRRIDWLETAGELGALLLEARQVKELMPIHNRLLRRNRSLWSLRVAEGTEAVRLQNLEQLGPDQLYGIFRSRAEAERFLREQIHQHGLCAKILGLESGPGPCFGYQIKKCRGACVGLESQNEHQGRLTGALTAHRVQSWPFSGPVAIREACAETGRTDHHLLENWCYLGTANSEKDLGELLQNTAQLSFDLDSYKILTRYLETSDERLELVEVQRSH